MRSFEEWYDQLTTLADIYGENVGDIEAWRECFEEGAAPADAFFSEFPEHID